MSIGTFIIVLAVWAAASYFVFAFFAMRSNGGASLTVPERNVAALTIAIPTVLALSFRSLDFGVDTLTYFGFYQQYCAVGRGGFESSYLVSFGLIQAASLGICSNALLVPVWAGLLVLAFLVLPVEWSTRVRLLALGLVSLVGIELATNAFRQGLSAAVLMIGVAWFGRNRVVGGILLLFSVALHSSAALALVAVALASLGWRWYIVGLAIIAVAALNYEALTFLPPVESLVYEITKYSAHEDSDFWIRVIAATQLATLVGIALVMRRRGGMTPSEEAQRAKSLSIAVKLALTALPYLAMPYFGYRYIYGIYLAVLFLAHRSVTDDRTSAFEALMLANIVLALAWTIGSSAIAGTTFLAI